MLKCAMFVIMHFTRIGARLSNLINKYKIEIVMDFLKNNEIDNKETSLGRKTFSDTFIDKLNDDFTEGQKVCEASNELVTSFKELPEKELSGEVEFVDRLSDEVGIDFILGFLSNEFLNSIHNNYGFNLSDKEIAESVQKASDFFHLSSPKDIREDWTTGVILGMKQKENDDVLCYNREQMRKMGITDREGFDLVMTHEGAHRALQSMEGRYNSHQEELCCDFLVGVRAGLNGMNEEKLIQSLEKIAESVSHPDGILRVEVIRAGVRFAKEYMAINNEAPSFSKCLERFDKKIDEMSGNIFDVAQDINLKEDVIVDGELKAFVDDKAYYLREAQTAKEWVEWHYKRADEAIAKGDLSSAKDHNSSAQLYERQAKEHLESASKCTK